MKGAPGTNSGHLGDGAYKGIFFNDHFCNLIQISLKNHIVQGHEDILILKGFPLTILFIEFSWNLDVRIHYVLTFPLVMNNYSFIYKLRLCLEEHYQHMDSLAWKSFIVWKTPGVARDLGANFKLRDPWRRFFFLHIYREVERSLGWKPWYSLETWKFGLQRLRWIIPGLSPRRSFRFNVNRTGIWRVTLGFVMKVSDSLSNHIFNKISIFCVICNIMGVIRIDGDLLELKW